MDFPTLEIQDVETHETWLDYIHTRVPNFNNYPHILIQSGLHKLEKRICQIEERLETLEQLLKERV